MNIYINEESDKINLFESGIANISFSNHGTVIEFKVDWLEGKENEFVNITCQFCSDLEIIIKHIDEHSGSPVITGFSYVKNSDFSYWVQFNFDFTPVGYIRLLCSRFIFETLSLPHQAGGNDHRIPWDPVKKEDALEYY